MIFRCSCVDACLGSHENFLSSSGAREESITPRLIYRFHAPTAARWRRRPGDGRPYRRRRWLFPRLASQHVRRHVLRWQTVVIETRVSDRPFLTPVAARRAFFWKQLLFERGFGLVVVRKCRSKALIMSADNTWQHYFTVANPLHSLSFESTT